MKKNILFCVIALLLVSFSILPDEKYNVYGKIVDSATGEIVKGVQVRLLLNNIVISSMMADSGKYEFNVSQTGTYKIEASQNEYNIFTDNAITITTDRQIRRDVILERPPRFLQIRKNGEEIETLDLGKIETPDIYIVDLFNSGYETLRFVTSKNRRWITSVTPTSDVIEPENNSSIAIRIDPTQFEAGQTTGKVLIMSDNGSKVLTIKAVGDYPRVKVMPMEISYPDAFEGQIIFTGEHTYSDRGFCFSTTNRYPTINDNRVSANDVGGGFIYRDIWDDYGQFPWLGSLNSEDEICQTWYVRAYLKYENENDIVIYSDNVEDFTLLEMLCPTCP